MNRVKVLVKLLNAGSFMILIAAIGETIRRTLNWIKTFGKPKVVA